MTDYDIDLPLWKGKPPLRTSQQLNSTRRAARSRRIRETVAWSAAALKIGLCEHVIVGLHYAPGDTRGRSHTNLLATMKPAVEGLVDAGLVIDADPAHVTTITPTIHRGPGTRRLWITVHITDLERS